MTPGPRFATDDEVIVTRGSRRGTTGIVVGPTPFLVRHFDVRFGDGLTRAIHEAFLRRADVPAPTESDDDVMSPLRRWGCP